MWGLLPKYPKWFVVPDSVLSRNWLVGLTRETYRVLRKIRNSLKWAPLWNHQWESKGWYHWMWASLEFAAKQQRHLRLPPRWVPVQAEHEGPGLWNLFRIMKTSVHPAECTISKKGLLDGYFWGAPQETSGTYKKWGHHSRSGSREFGHIFSAGWCTPPLTPW
jgi:hypothetical protein